MMVVVSYDVNTMNSKGQRRLRRVAKICLDYGQRVQFSVFECLVDPVQFMEMQNRLKKEFNPQEDSLRFYLLGKNWQKRVEHWGIKEPVNPEGTLIV